MHVFYDGGMQVFGQGGRDPGLGDGRYKRDFLLVLLDAILDGGSVEERTKVVGRLFVLGD